MTLEVVKGLAKIPEELKADAYLFLVKSGRQLIRMVQENKKK